MAAATAGFDRTSRRFCRRRRRRQVGVFGGRAAGAGIGFFAALRSLREGDRDQAPVFFVGGRFGDLRQQTFEEGLGGGEAGRLFGGAGGFGAVVAGIGDDVGERRRGFDVFEVGVELVEADVPFAAFGPFGDVGE